MKRFDKLWPWLLGWLVLTVIILIVGQIAFSYNENTIFVKNAVQSTVVIFWTGGLGAGTIIDEDGYIATAKHVVEGTNSVMVYTRDWEAYKGRVVAIHEGADVAIIKIEPIKPLIAMKLAPVRTIEIGDDVYVIGHTFGIPWTLKRGIISRVDWETEDGIKYIQLDAAIAEGNSGGAMVDHWGRMIGVVVMGAMPFGWGNIGFALQAHQFEAWALDIITKDIARMNILINW